MPSRIQEQEQQQHHRRRHRQYTLIPPSPSSTLNKLGFPLVPTHGGILDIGGSYLRSQYVDQLKEALLAVNDSADIPTLPDELLYDDRGLLIWNQIISIPQFYQTHDEIALFNRNGADIIRHIPNHVTMIDLGSGDTNKVNHFLVQLQRQRVPATYLALDISKTSLDQSIASLVATHSGSDSFVRCGGLWGTFDNCLHHVDGIHTPRLFLSLGSVLCNDPWPTALNHLRKWASSFRPHDLLLIGMDGHLAPRHRDKIWSAYHSCDAVFHKFFLNGLQNANKLLGYNLFDQQDWDLEAELEQQPTTRHRFYIRAKRDVAMHGGGKIRKGQEIDWFDSHKYSEDNVRLMCVKAGLTIVKSWKAPDSEFRQYLVRRKTDNDVIEDHDSGVSGVN